jgi:hypothetical protein
MEKKWAWKLKDLTSKCLVGIIMRILPLTNLVIIAAKE